MPGFADYGDYDGLGLAELVRTRQVSSRELIESAIEAIEAQNPDINAVCRPLFDEARIQADFAPQRKGLLAGIPFLIKDLTGHIAGVETNAGCALLKGHVPRKNTELFRRFRKAGLIAVGVTATPEMGLQVTTESPLYGPTRNPWNLEHSPGGSSGGSAAAVAAGIVPVADASDGAGSIRIPASCCGLVGVKPTKQRTPSGPLAGELFGGLGVEFPVTRSVRDAAAILDEVHGADIGAPYILPPPVRPYLEETKREPGSLRIAFIDKTFSGEIIHPDCSSAVRDTALLCEQLGHHVENAQPDFNVSRLTSVFQTYFGTVGCTILELLAKKMGRVPSPENVEPVTWSMYQEAKATSAFDFNAAGFYFGRVQRLLGRFFDRYDALITPVLTKPPVRIGELKDANGDLHNHWYNTIGDGYSPFCFPFNVTGQPAASLPLFQSRRGLPIGVQVITRFADESTLFRLAAQLERASPWCERRAPT